MKQFIYTLVAATAALLLLSCTKESPSYYSGDINLPAVTQPYTSTVEVFLAASQGEPAGASVAPGTVEVTVTASEPVPCKVLVRDNLGNTHILLKGKDTSTFGSVPAERYGHYESIVPKCVRVIPAKVVIDGVRYIFTL